jgi:hypothetical protein
MLELLKAVKLSQEDKFLTLFEKAL